MPLMRRHWRVARRLSDDERLGFADFSRYLSASLAERTPHLDTPMRDSISRLIVQLLFNRGIREQDEMRSFVDCLPPSVDDPYRLKGMKEAVERLIYAVQAGEKMAVYGDYDADGITATAVMVETLRALGGHVVAYIPDRFDEGYGLNQGAIDELAGQGVTLVLTVDNGIRSVSDVAYGHDKGLEFILTDHHAPGHEIPPALAVINPKQPDCAYPYKQLAGVGLAYKLARALRHEAHPNTAVAPDDLLDLVAVGTVADVAPLTGENRFLVARGLSSLRTTHRTGLRALFKVSGVDGGNIDSWHIGFNIGPRLNAAGRLDSAQPALELLLTQDPDAATALAERLDEQNRERRALTEDTVDGIRRFIEADRASSLLYLAAESAFNPGVVGLAAGRLADEFYRPVLVAQRGDAVTRGSARSIPGFHITHALDECSDLLERHGGHSAAAGFTVRNENLMAFHTRLLEVASRELRLESMIPVLEIDAELALAGVKREMVDALDLLRPFGEANPKPVFVSRNLEVKEKRQIGSESQHLKLRLYDGKQVRDAIAFRWGSRLDDIPAVVDVAYVLDINSWNGREELQLKVEDMRPAGAEDMLPPPGAVS